MKRRLASAAVGVPILLLAAYLGVPAVAAIAIAAGLVGGYEIARMSAPASGRINVFLVGMPATVAGSGLAIAYRPEQWWFVAAALAVAAAPAVTFEAVRRSRSEVSFGGVAAAAYLGLLLAHAPLLRSLDDGREWFLVALLTTFAIDTAAFFTGRAIGRRKLAPRISAAKTWEGAGGGLAAGVAATIGLTFAFDLDVNASAGALIGAAAGAVAIVGDLLESAFKRRAGVKEAGGFIPGHGGILDRLDSIAPNLAVVYWLSVWLSR